MKREHLEPEKFDRLGQRVTNKPPETKWRAVRADKPWLEKGPNDKLRTNIPENEHAG